MKPPVHRADRRPAGEPWSRRAFMAGALTGSALLADRSPASAEAFGVAPHARSLTVEKDAGHIASPNGRLRFELLLGDRGRLAYRVTLGGLAVIEASALGIVVDNIDLGGGVLTGKLDLYRIDESYATRGVHSRANNRCSGARASLMHRESRTRFTIEVRVFDDGVAFRYLVPGDERSRVPDEATAFTIPTGSWVWYHDFEGHYEGIHARKEISQVQSAEWAAPPLTIKLPGSAGYASITEASLANYSGMGLQSDGRNVFKARLGHAHPVSYPFRLRYGADEGTRLASAAAISGTITTPWRV